MTTRKILLVDDHPLMTEGLRQLLASQAGLSICGIAGSVQQAIALVESTKPDLIITDLTLPGRNGLELIKDLGSTHPAIPIIVLSMHDELLYAERVLRAGGRGYVTKNSPTERILEAIHRVLDGGVFASPAVTSHFLQAMLPSRSPAKPSFPLDRLTDREIEVFELIGHAKSNHDISSQLGISTRTVDVHRAHIREKLGLEDGNALTRHAIRWVEVGMIGSSAPAQ
ncbi:MAG: response regulator transcription factor [Verrucomicrobia bacterium]|nr:MAG: response regulator transcription factor [Verrucomicrobiota bacterium]